MEAHDKRIHPRIEVAVEIQASGPLGKMTGTLRDLSKGGAGLYLTEYLGEKGDTVELFLPLVGGNEITVMGEILRIEERPKGILHGIRFTLVEPSLQDKLLELLETLLHSKGVDQRVHPRVAKRLPIAFRKASELRAILENISMGGLGMTVQQPLVLYEEVELSIPDIKGEELLIVRGRVIHQTKGESGEAGTYRVGLQFKDLSEAAASCIKGLIRHLLELDEATSKATA